MASFVRIGRELPEFRVRGADDDQAARTGPPAANFRKVFAAEIVKADSQDGLRAA
jgi:hypothetical protein